MVNVSKQRETSQFTSGFEFEREVDNDDAYLLSVRRCFWHDFFGALGLPQLTTVLCAFDQNWFTVIEPERHGFRFERKTTLGYGATLCPFHFFVFERNESHLNDAKGKMLGVGNGASPRTLKTPSFMQEEKSPGIVTPNWPTRRKRLLLRRIEVNKGCASDVLNKSMAELHVGVSDNSAYAYPVLLPRLLGSKLADLNGIAQQGRRRCSKIRGVDNKYETQEHKQGVRQKAFYRCAVSRE